MGGRGIRGAKKGAHYSAPRAFRHRGGALARAAGGPGPLLGRPAAPRPLPRRARRRTPARPRRSWRRSRPKSSASRARSAPSRSSATGSPRSCAARSCRWARCAARCSRCGASAPRRPRGAPRSPPRSTTRESQLADNRAALAGQLRAAYLIGRQEPLKLLLNQQDPALAGRMFAYYSYFGRARAGQIKLIENDVQRIAELRGGARRARTSSSRSWKSSSARSCSELEQAREQRARVLASLEVQSHTRAQNLERLRASRPDSRSCCASCAPRSRTIPVDGNDAFARLRGKLAWPVERAPGGALRRDARRRGALGRGARGHRARRAGEGGVPGPRHLRRLAAGPGAAGHRRPRRRLPEPLRPQRAALQGGRRAVAAGDAIAAAGDSGGSSRPELYFEIRKGGKPVDPRPWFRPTPYPLGAAAPPAPTGLPGEPAVRTVIRVNVLRLPRCADSPTRARTAAPLRAIVAAMFQHMRASAIGDMNQAPTASTCPASPVSRFEPYVRLMRSLLPRTSCIAMFGAVRANSCWSTDTMTGPDLINIVDDALLAPAPTPEPRPAARCSRATCRCTCAGCATTSSSCWRILAVAVPRPAMTGPQGPRLLLRLLAAGPALECLRRDLMARTHHRGAATSTVGGLDKDLDLLLARAPPRPRSRPPTAPTSCSSLLQQTIEHLHAGTGALLVPEKNVTLVRARERRPPPDTQFLMRAHRHLLSHGAVAARAGGASTTPSSPEQPGRACPTACCAARCARAPGAAIGVLALLRDAERRGSRERDAHLAEILARKADRRHRVQLRLR